MARWCPTPPSGVSTQRRSVKARATGSLWIMPTRAPAPSRRPDGGTRGRGPAAGGRSARDGGRSGGARPARTKATARRGGAHPMRRRVAGRGAPGALNRVLRALWRAVVGLWSVLARGFGRGARDLDPAHHRDGLGLTFLAAALVVAVGVWFSAGGPLGAAVSALVHGAVGITAALVPLPLAWLGVRLLRHPDRFDPGIGGRLLIGWTAFALGALGLVHLAAGNPVPPDGATAMRHAGGLLGFFAASPLTSALSRYVAAPLLLLLAGFGLLVVTATPVHAVPAAGRALVHRLTRRGSAKPDGAGGADEASAEPPGLDPGPPLPPLRRRPARRRQGLAAESQPDDQPDTAARTVEPIPDEPPAPAPPTPREASPSGPSHAEQMVLGGGTEGDYRLPPPDLLAAGTPPKARSRANDNVIEALTEVLGQFGVDAAVTGFSRGPPVTRY